MRKWLWILVLGSTAGMGQTFRGEATLPDITTDGFYRIYASPAICAHLNEPFSNLRIYDQRQKEVPYIFEKEEPAYYTTQFKPYEVVSKEQQKDCCTTLILRNHNSRPINNISLSIKNADVTKAATLLGSDDKKNWFALKERFTLSAIDNHDNTSEVRIIDFPLSNYTYYQLQLDDSTSAPINLLGAGYYEVTSEDGKYTALQPKSINQSTVPADKQSLITIDFDTMRVVDKVVLNMTGAPYFLRRATLLSAREITDPKGVKSLHYQQLARFELSSKQTSVIELPGVRVQKLVVRIENEDNPVLDLGSVTTYQLNRYFTAWLKKGDHYTLKLGAPNLAQPKYDLAFFRDNIPAQPPLLRAGAIKMFDTEKEEIAPTFFTNSIIIWIAIIAVVIVLGFMAVRMTHETSKR